MTQRFGHGMEPNIPSARQRQQPKANRAIVGFKILIFVLALVPMTRLLMNGYLDALGANPVEKILHNTGFWTLSFLMITLWVTPLRSVTGWTFIGRFRRMLGLFAFFYVVLHFLSYLVLDQFFDWPNILKDISKRPYITVGFSAFLILIPLAVTSTDGMMRRLGGKRWRGLHRWVYLAGFAGVVHFWWLVKKDITEPSLFAIAFSVAMIVRVLMKLRKRPSPSLIIPH
ncbi:MAG: protein-methionine-sulfoxide reductase heme-binding subunit MsrQ [Methylococcus sp.]|jgi:methionine sulfoxide reductase heme-binding subunit